MRRLIALCCALSLTGVHYGEAGASLLKKDEAKWAKLLRLNQSYVSSIVKAAGYSDEDQVRIETLDIRHLSARKHILLVTAAGNGHCLTLTVLTRKTESIQKIWEVSETPEGAGFCHVGAHSGNFKAYATSSGSVIVVVPKDEEGNYIVSRTGQLVYKWNGKTYMLNDDLKH
jgi:hypothetical protein